MPEFELYYFDTSGRAAIARMLFKLAGVEFKDTRYSKEEWAAVKADRSKYPFNQLPVLRVDSTCIAESDAINQYLAGEFGLHGSTPLDRARVNTINSQLRSLGALIIRFIFEENKEVAAANRAKFFDEQLPHALSCMEEILQQRENGDKYFLGEKISFADVAFLDASLYVTAMNKDAYDKYPKLKALKQRLESNHIIAEYLPTRKVNV